MPLSDIPNIDYYMESKGEKGENDETKIGKEEGTEHIQGEKIIRILLMTLTWIKVMVNK